MAALTALPTVLEDGLLDTAAGLTMILLVLAFMTLARVRNPEQLRDLAPSE